MKKLCLSAFILLFLLNFVACENILSVKNIKYDAETVNIAVSDLSNGRFNPLFAEDETDKAVSDIVFETLFNYNNGAIEPVLVESIKISNDGLIYDIKLRENVKWHNMLDFTSEDIEETIKFALREADNNMYYFNLLGIEGVKQYYLGETDSIYGIQIISSHNLKIVLKKKDDGFLEKLSRIYILQAQQIENAKKDNSLEYDLLWKEPVGTGAYFVSNYVEEQSVELLKNESYWGDISNVEKYVFNAVNDDFAKKSFLSGDMNIITDIFLNDDDSKDYLKQNAKFADNDFYTNQVIIANNTSKYLSNKFVRQALMYALEREVFLDIFSYANEEDKNTKETLSLYEYNPSKAIDILTKTVGWQYIDGKMIFNNEQVKLELLYTNSDKVSRFCHSIIKENLESIGIKIDAILVNSKELYRRLNADLYDLALYSIDERNEYEFYDYICYNSKKSNKNYSNYTDFMLEWLIEGYYSSNSDVQKNVFTEKINEILNKDMPILLMFRYKSTRIISQNLSGIQSNSINDYYNINKWSIVN